MTHECVVWDFSCSPQRRVAVDGEMLSQGMGGMAFTQSSQGIARAGLFVDVSSTMLSALSRFTHARPFFSVAIPTLTNSHAGRRIVAVHARVVLAVWWPLGVLCLSMYTFLSRLDTQIVTAHRLSARRSHA